MAAVGKFVLWGKENLCLIRAQEGALVLETLFFAEDVRSKKEIEDVVGETAIAEAELQLAGQVISSLAGEWSPEDFANDYREDLKHDARGEARRPRGRRAGAGRRDAGDRSHGGAPPAASPTCRIAVPPRTRKPPRELAGGSRSRKTPARKSA